MISINKNNKKNVFMDGANYQREFLPQDSEQWVYQDVKDKIEKFIQDICQQYNLFVLFDQANKSDEAIKKWKDRKIEKFKEEIIDYPYNFLEFVYRIFKSQQKKYKNLQVFYCLDDADDIIASLAYINNKKDKVTNRDKNYVLSQDNDYFRYQSIDGKFSFFQQYINQFPFKIYKSIKFNEQLQKYELHENYKENDQMIISKVENNQVKVVKQTKPQKKHQLTKISEPKYIQIRNLEDDLKVLEKKICGDKTKFELHLEEWKELKELSHQYVGIGTDLIKKFGNPLYELRQLIAQLLHKKGINFPIKHTFLIKNNDNEPVWQDVIIQPDQNQDLIEDPMKAAKDLNLFKKITPDLDEKEALDLIKHNVCIYSIVIGFIENRDNSDLTQKLTEINTEDRFDEYLEQQYQFQNQGEEGYEEEEKQNQEEEKEEDNYEDEQEYQDDDQEEDDGWNVY